MGSLFSLEGGFFSWMGKIFDIMLVSLLWVLCCLPIITIGPATTALYYCVVKSIRRERGYIAKEFFHSFKVNFKQGAIVSLIFIVLTVVMSFNFFIVRQMEGKLGSILFGIYVAICLFSVIIAIYLFPNLSRFTLTLKNLFKNSIIMAIRHLPFTVILTVIVAISAFLIWWIPITALFIPGTACLLVSIMMEKILKKYTPEDAGRPDAWYME